MKCINKHMHRNWYIKYLSLECISYIIKYVHKQINKYDCLSKIHYCTHWHINLLKLLLCLCVWFYSSFLYTCVCVFLHIQSPSRECRSIRSGASGLPYYCAPLVCVSEVMELLAVWRHNKPKTKNQKPRVRVDYTHLPRCKHVTWIAGVPSSQALPGYLYYCNSICVRSWCNWRANCVDSNPKKVYIPEVSLAGPWFEDRIWLCHHVRSPQDLASPRPSFFLEINVGFPSTAPLTVCVSAVLGTLAVWIPNQKKNREDTACDSWRG